MSTPLENWVEEVARLTKPDRIWWCDGSDEDAHRIMEAGMKEEKIEGKSDSKVTRDRQEWQTIDEEV